MEMATRVTISPKFQNHQVSVVIRYPMFSPGLEATRISWCLQKQLRRVQQIPQAVAQIHALARYGRAQASAQRYL